MIRKIVLLSVMTSFLAGTAYARPEILLRYAADPFSRPEMRVCGTCHYNPAGTGARNPFGQAVARYGFRITPELRREFPDRFLPSKEASGADAQGRPLKAVWSSARDEETVIQIGEERFLLNRKEGTLQKISSEQAAAFAAPVQPEKAAPPAAFETQPEVKTLPTFDYYLVNLPTNRPRTARSLHMRFTHRFAEPVAQGTGRLRDLFGLDSVSVSSFGLEAGVTRWLTFQTYRMPRFFGADQTIELGPKFQILEQSGRSPIGLSLRATVEGQRNFTERFTTNLQPAFSRAFGDRAEFFIVPTFSLGVPRRSLTFDFPLTPGERRDNQVAIGTGFSIRIRPRTAIVGEWAPRVGGFRGLGSRNTYSFAIQRRTDRHVFALVFSNNQLTTTTRSISDGRDDVRIGFNLYRRIW